MHEMYLISHETAAAVIALEEWVHVNAISRPQLMNVQSLQAWEDGNKRPHDATVRCRQCKENEEDGCVCKAVVSHHIVFIQAEEAHSGDKEHRGVERIRRHEIRTEHKVRHREARCDEILAEVLVEMENAHNLMEADFRAEDQRDKKPDKIHNN